MTPQRTSILSLVFCVTFFCPCSFGRTLEFEAPLKSIGVKLGPENSQEQESDEHAMKASSLSDKRYVDDDEDNGGPSSEFRPLGYDWAMETSELVEKRGVDTECLSRKRSEVIEGVTAEELCADEKDFFLKLPKVMQHLEKKLLKTLESARLKGIVTGRIKSLGSLIGKMNKNGITDVREITDIVGLRVTLQTMSDIRKFKKEFLTRNNAVVSEIRCYGTCGPDVGVTDPREKIYWPWKGSGYRRLHFKISLPSLKTEAEIQIGTPYMTLWAEWEHAVVYKGPEKLQNNVKARSYAQKLAKYYMMLDSMRDEMNPACPGVLLKTSARDIFREHDWEVFGKPNNACNFWNDLDVDMP